MTTVSTTAPDSIRTMARREEDTISRADTMRLVAQLFPGSEMREVGYSGGMTEVLVHPAGCGSGFVSGLGPAAALNIQLSNVPRDLGLRLLAILATLAEDTDAAS